MLEFSIEKNIWERLEPEKVNLFLLEQETKKITGKEQKRIDELKNIIPFFGITDIFPKMLKMSGRQRIYLRSTDLP